MNALIAAKFAIKITASSLIVFQGFSILNEVAPSKVGLAAPAPASSSALNQGSRPQTVLFADESSAPQDVGVLADEEIPAPAYPFGNPAGCAASNPNLTPDQMLSNAQAAIGSEYNLAERRQTYVWNGKTGTMLDVAGDAFVYEFVFNEFQHPLTYRGDKLATVFLTNGFVVWFREYNGSFRLTAIPMVPGVNESQWAGYVASYWQKGGAPDDEYIYPVMKKLPCRWVVEAGYVSNETLTEMFDLDWNIPDYLAEGRKYLADNCKDANRVSREQIGYWDASSMCGPLAWTIMRDANGFPYRIGSWSEDMSVFTGANPRWKGQPWSWFDPETFTLYRTDERLSGYDFASKGNLYPGDVVYSYATLYVTEGYFDHILLVAAIDENNNRLSVSNMVRNHPYLDCSIEEVKLYAPGDLAAGVMNYEWNGNGYGRTGTTGFDVFRWNWISYHINGQSMSYAVRWGDTLETIAFDWKISPEAIRTANDLASDAQLTPGQIITLPAPAAGF